MKYSKTYRGTFAIAALLAMGPMNDAPAAPADEQTAWDILNSGNPDDRNIRQIDMALGEIKDEFDGIIKVKPEDRTGDQKNRVQELVNRATSLKQEREQLDAMTGIDGRAIDNALRGGGGGDAGGGGDGGDDYESRREAINAYYRTGEVANVLVTTDGGGVQVPEESHGAVFEKMKGFSSVLPLVTVTTTTNGGTIPIPVLDDTANSGRQRASEVEDTNEVDPDVTGFSLGAFPITSDRTKVSHVLLRDASYDVEGKVEEILLRRLARKVSSDAILADGANKTNGLINAAGLNVDTTNAGTFDTFGDLIEMIGVVDSAYADVDDAQYAISRKLYVEMLKLKESQNKYHEVFEKRNGVWYFNDYAVRVFPQMSASIAAGEVHAMFGWFKAYQLRLVANPRMRRSDKNMTVNETVEFAAFWEMDGDLADANALTKLTIKA